MGRKLEKYLSVVFLFLFAQFQSAAQSLDSFTLESDSLVVGQIMEIKCDLFWTLDSPTVCWADTACFDSLFSFIEKFSNNRFELQLHTDCRGSTSLNLSWSDHKIKKAMEPLVGLGLNKDQFVPKGYGESQLKNDCWCEKPTDPGYVDCNEWQHLENRRLVLKVIM